MKKVLSLFLAIVMVALMLPMSAIFASANNDVSGLDHYIDFTKLPADDGKDGDINPTLVANAPGYVANIDDYVDNWATSIGENGIMLGGANSDYQTYQAIGWTNQIGLPEGIINGTTDYIVEFTWNTTFKFANLEFGWNESANSYAPAAEAGAKGTTTMNYANPGFRFSVCAGVGHPAGEGDGKLSGNGTWKDAEGNEITNIASIFKPLVLMGADITMSIVVKGGYAAAVHMTAFGENVVSYYPPSADAIPAKGYFQINLSGWGDNNTVNIKSLGVKALAASEDFTAPITPAFPVPTGKVVHNLDFAQVTDLANTPYIYQTNEVDDSTITLADGAVWHEVNEDDDSDDNLSGIRIPASIVEGLTDYTLEIDFAAGSSSRILFVSFGLGENDMKHEDNSWKLRFSEQADGQSDSWGINIDGNPAYGADLGIGKRLQTEDFTARMIINDNVLVIVVIVLNDGTELVLVPNGVRKAGAGDIVLSQNVKPDTTNKIGIKSVTITDDSYIAPATPDTPDAGDYLAGTTNYDTLYSVDFSTIKSDSQLKDAGWNIDQYLAPGATSTSTITYPDYGVKMKTTSDTFLVLDKVQLNTTDNYVIDYTFKYDESCWIFFGCMGIPAPTGSFASSDYNATNTDTWKMIDGNSCFKIRANEGDNRCGADGFTYYTDENYFHQTTKGFTDEGIAAALTEFCDIRVRILVTAGTCTKVFLTVGDEEYYALRSKGMSGIAGYFGFMQNGSVSGNARALGLIDFKISKCDLVDLSGGNTVTAEKTKDYQDKAATYYKDGYMLHYMDFSKVNTFADTGYSFTADSSAERVVDVRGDKLYIANKSDSGAYLLFTGNAIPQAITEYTVMYDFCFKDGGDKPYLSFIRGLTLDENNARDRSREVDVYQKNVTKPAYVGDATPDDETKWATIAEAIKSGETVSIAISSIARKIDKVMVVYGDTMVTFKMDDKANKEAYEGYMGLKISPKSAVEVSNIMVVAGAYDYFKDMEQPIMPAGLTLGDLVQNVTADAVNTTGTKPDYSGSTTGGITGGEDEETTAATTKATEADTKKPEETEAEKKKGCKSSVAIALPALIVTTVFGCAVCTKKKED